MKNLPNWKDKRDFLYADKHKISEQEAVELATQAISQKSFQDAIDYNLIGNSVEIWGRLKQCFIENGDYFFAKQILDAGQTLSESELTELANHAEKCGKLVMAYHAYGHIQDENNQTRLKKIISEKYRDIFPEESNEAH